MDRRGSDERWVKHLLNVEDLVCCERKNGDPETYPTRGVDLVWLGVEVRMKRKSRVEGRVRTCLLRRAGDTESTTDEKDKDGPVYRLRCPRLIKQVVP